MRRPRHLRNRLFTILAMAGLLALAAFPGIATAKVPAGSLDPSFGGNRIPGISSVNFGDFEQTSEWIDTASLPDGSTYLMADTPFRLFRIEADGKLDGSFGNAGVERITSMVGNRSIGWNKVFTAPDGGAILIGGAGAAGDVMVVNRLRPDGSQDPDFGRGRPIFFAKEQWIAGGVDDSGRILLVGYGGEAVMRLTPSGHLDGSFGVEGVARMDLNASDYPYDVLATDDGIYVTFYTRTFRLTPAGKLDPTFGGVGVVRYGGNQIAAAPGGVMIQTSGGMVQRLSLDGTPFPGYGPTGNGIAWGLASTNTNGAVMPDGSVIFVGDRTPDSGDRLYSLSRIDPNGIPDAAFGGDGSVEADWLDGVGTPGLWPLAGGSAVAWGGQPGRISFREVDQAGNLNPDFGTEGVGTIKTGYLPDADLTDSAKRRDHTYLAVGSIQQSRGYNYGVALASFTRNGKPESGFGDGGRLILANPTMRWNPKAKLTLLPAGGAMVCAKVSRDSVVWKVSRNGDLVKNFGDEGRLTLPFSGRCQDISFDGRGAVLSAMDIDQSRRGMDLTRVLPNGQIDRSYGDDGIARRTEMADGDYFWVYFSSLVPDRNGGTLLVVSNGDARYIVRYTKNGFPDKSFGIGGKLHYGTDSVSQSKDGQKPMYLPGLIKINGTALGRGGSIFITGLYAKKPFVAKLGPRGFPVRSYGKRGVVILPEATTSQAPYFRKPFPARPYGIGVRRNGSVIVTGASRPACLPNWGCSHPLLLKRVKPNGKVDRAFGKRAFLSLGLRPDAIGNSVYFDGKKTVVAGSMDFAPERSNFLLARFR